MPKYLPIGMVQRQSQEQKENSLIKRFKDSGMTQEEFCSTNGISRSTLCAILRRRGLVKKTIAHRQDKQPRVGINIHLDLEVLERLTKANDAPSELINTLLRKHYRMRK